MVAARRNSPLVVGLGRGRELPRLRRRRVHRAHPRGAGARPGPGRHDHPRGRRRSPASTARPPRARRYHVDWDLSAAEKDGHDWFMRKEIFEQPRAVADSLLGRRTPAGLLQLDEMRLSDQELRDIDKIIIIACGTSFYAGHGREVRHRALDPDPGRGRAGLGVPLPRPDPRPPPRWSSRSASPARPPTPCRRSGTRATQRSRGAGDLQHQRLDDPARVRRGDLHPRRARRSGSPRPRAS